MSACHNQPPAPAKAACGSKSHHTAAPSPHSVLLVAVFLTFPLALVLLVGQRVSNPTTINSGKVARDGRGGLGMGQTPGATKQVMGWRRPDAFRRRTACHNEKRRPTSLACPPAQLVYLPQLTLEGSETLSRQQKSSYGCPPLPIPCCWWLCFSLFLSRWFVGRSDRDRKSVV